MVILIVSSAQFLSKGEFLKKRQFGITQLRMGVVDFKTYPSSRFRKFHQETIDRLTIIGLCDQVYILIIS